MNIYQNCYTIALIILAAYVLFQYKPSDYTKYYEPAITDQPCQKVIEHGDWRLVVKCEDLKAGDLIARDYNQTSLEYLHPSKS